MRLTWRQRLDQRSDLRAIAEWPVIAPETLEPWQRKGYLRNQRIVARVLADERFAAIAEDLGLNMEQWNADRESPIVHQKVNQDIQRGLELRIDVTPSVFVNGRRVIEPSLAVLTNLIEHELHPEQ